MRMAPQLGLSPSSGQYVATLAPLSLSAATIEEGAAAGTLVGAIIGATSGSTVTLQAQSNANWFAKDGNDIEAGASATDYETAPAPTITLRETLVSASNSPRDTVIAITVTNVLEVTLGALNLDDLTHAPTDAQGTLVGSITGASSGSTITLLSQEVTDAYQKDGNDIEIGPAGPLSAGERDITLRETHPDASNSPRDTVLTITSEAVLGNELYPQPSFDATTGLTVGDWTVSGGTATSPGSTGFLQATPTEALTTGTYRIVLDVASGSSDVQVLVANGGSHTFPFTGAGVYTQDIVVSAINEQNIRIRDINENIVVLNGISVKKHQ